MCTSSFCIDLYPFDISAEFNKQPRATKHIRSALGSGNSGQILILSTGFAASRPKKKSVASSLLSCPSYLNTITFAHYELMSHSRGQGGCLFGEQRKA
jgi:hypothetical protein